MDLCEFKASLVYRASSRTARATQKNPVSKNQTNQLNKQNNIISRKIDVTEGHLVKQNKPDSDKC